MSAFMKLEKHVEHFRSMADIPVREWGVGDEVLREYGEGSMQTVELYNRKHGIVFRMNMTAGAAFPLHCHEGIAQTSVILSGSVEFYIVDDSGEEHFSTLTSGPGGTIEIEPGVGHRWQALEASEVIVILVPRDAAFDK